MLCNYTKMGWSHNRGLWCLLLNRQWDEWEGPQNFAMTEHQTAQTLEWDIEKSDIGKWNIGNWPKREKQTVEKGSLWYRFVKEQKRSCAAFLEERAQELGKHSMEALNEVKLCWQKADEDAKRKINAEELAQKNKEAQAKRKRKLQIDQMRRCAKRARDAQPALKRTWNADVHEKHEKMMRDNSEDDAQQLDKMMLKKLRRSCSTT